jgi:hypothetical protein
LNRDESIEQGLVAEQSFFDNTEPWRGLPDKSILGTKNLRVKLAELQMNMIRSSFKGIEQELKAKRDKAALAYQELGKVPSNLSEKRSLFQSVKEEISKGISTLMMGGRICSTQSNKRMRPSAQFHENANLYQTCLNSSRLANISKVAVGSKIIVVNGEDEIRGEVVKIDSDGDVYLKEIVVENVKRFAARREPGQIVTTNSGHVYHVKNDDTVDRLKPIDRTFV